jgi:hypothetical protein
MTRLSTSYDSILQLATLASYLALSFRRSNFKELPKVKQKRRKCSLRNEATLKAVMNHQNRTQART